MLNPVSPGRLSFEENISSLLEELLLAAKWHRPSILLAVHKSKFGQDKAEKALADRLAQQGHSVVRITVDRDHSDIPHLIASEAAAEQSIFFVSNIDWGGGEDRRDAYRALNIYRELFVDHRLKAVFWLMTNEAGALARYAPDFWAFRHRVIEFTGQRIPHKVTLPAGALLWDIQNSVDPFDTLEARVKVREELLARLPNRNEARSAHIDLLYNLGYLFWMMDKPGQAGDEFNEALALAAQVPVGKIKSSVLNGLALLSYEAGDCERAAELLQKAVKESPAEAYLVINQSAVTSTLGRNQDAMDIAKRAVKLGAREPRVWSTLGYIYASVGKAADAINCFHKAAELAPGTAIHHAALAICYDLVGRPDETVRELGLAHKLAAPGMIPQLGIYEAALQDDPSTSVDRAQAAIRAGQLSRQELRRDPNLTLLLDPTRIAEITS